MYPQSSTPKLWTNNSATFGKTKTFQVNIFVLICLWKDIIWRLLYAMYVLPWQGGYGYDINKYIIDELI